MNRNRNKGIKGFEAASNSGGDFLQLSCRHEAEDLITVSIGHCCVNTLQAVLPLEVVTAVLTKWTEDCNGDIENGIQSVWGDNPEYTKVLIQRYREANLLTSDR